MDRNLRIGIIGASAGRGWAKDSHVPAVQQLAGLELGGVVTRDQASADAAARAFGAARGYADAASLLRDPAIDIVAIAVKVPDHRDLVLAAVAAGKHVYCEWPLGRDLAESEALASAARAAAGVHTAIGLQTRLNPSARRARELIASGAIGRVLSARIVSTTMAFGTEVEPAMAFAEDAANGVTLATIQGAHSVDVAAMVLGGLADAAALVSTQFPAVTVGADKAPRPRRIPDHLLLQGRIAGGAPLSVEVVGGRPADAVPFRFEVTGETGTLLLDGGAPRGFQTGRLVLRLDGEVLPVEQGELSDLPDAALNVAAVYAALRDDIHRGSFTVPDFGHAVRLARLIDDLLASSATGNRKRARDWPGAA